MTGLSSPEQSAVSSPSATSSGSLFDGIARYEKVRDLNRGAFGVVVLAHDRQRNDQVALKFIPRGPAHINKYVEREVVNHMKLHHPHIIALREVFLTSAHLVLAMEYAEGGDLACYTAARGGLGEEDARWFFQQLMIAVDYCHRMGVTSRDIKLQNMLLDGGTQPLIKLADFGFSKDANQHSAPSSRVGTPAYLAPEVVKLQPGQQYDGQKADIWSCGVALFILVTNHYPFRRAGDETLARTQRLQAMLMRILRGDYSFPPDRPLSEGLQDLIRRILVVDPEERLSIQRIMEHPWFREGLNPAALQYNDGIVWQSQAAQPSQDVLDEVAAIVQQAATLPVQPGHPEKPGGSGGMSSLDRMVEEAKSDSLDMT